MVLGANPMRDHKGFTLIEIMVVVGITGILATMAVVSYLRSREFSAKNACIENLSQIDAAKQQWAFEHNKAMSDTPQEADIGTYIKGDSFPECPTGGTYSINNIGTDPTCTMVGHEL